MSEEVIAGTSPASLYRPVQLERINNSICLNKKSLNWKGILGSTAQFNL